MKHAHAMPFGATVRADGSGADLHLWAPAATEVALLLGPTADALAPVPAARAEGGWWHAAVDGAAAGARYQWRIDGGQRVSDPAARENPDGPHAPSRLVDPAAFDWNDAGWTGRPWRETVLYELHVGTFTAEGTFDAAAQRLEELAALGITAVELMPVADLPGRYNWGYDGVALFAPAHSYGPPESMKAFVERARQLGLMVFLDVVYNHFGPDGNWLGLYAPQFFSATHASPWGQAINFDGDGSATVREFFIHNALYWIEEFRIDGLRLDAVHAIVDDSRPDILEEISSRVRAAQPHRHVHLVLENDGNQSRRLARQPAAGRYDGQWNDDFHHAMHVALTGETHRYYARYGNDPIALLGQVLVRGFAFPESADDAPPPLPATINYIGNHDQVGNRARGERLAALAPPEAVSTALLLALLTPATPMVFFGDEWGTRTPFLYFADWQGELREAVRAGRKREFAHDDDGTLPDPCDIATFHRSHPDPAERDQSGAGARLAQVRQALALRRQWIAPRQERLADTDHEALRIGATGLHLRWHYRDGSRLLLDLNLGPDPVDASALAGRDPQAQLLLAHGDWPAAAPYWAPWSARWRLFEPSA
ncbi:malto-oligosyltrehalose trehalohydrolase [Xylophilus sp.]|uniref:malto-oligosyltrehalose trehalohydrolase n=1 Tax=Xylophilus sp. TaxID=2653893 RepID=UPI0013BDEA90|nr:malto-oligosyltrehalose trehalohydrolase [Xylophilus sp.]KAF1049874.1 MAG: Malto-oligosyltrehalose trehalohydrolase [Xylophilus sp.]